ncbi:Ca2+ transporter [Ilyonectria robusta]
MLEYYSFYLLLGFLATCLAGYILSQVATNITDQFGILDILFGIVILTIATTLPEKFITVISGYRGHPGILVANCVGSNIFLLALYLKRLVTPVLRNLRPGGTCSDSRILGALRPGTSGCPYGFEIHPMWLRVIMCWLILQYPHAAAA